MKRTAVTLLLLLAGVAGAADYTTATKHDELRAPARASSREASPRKVQWAPTGNFPALHARAVFEEESSEAARPYAREGGPLAAVSFYQRWYDSTTGRFLSRDSVGAGSYLATPNGLGVWGYANGNPARFTDPDGRMLEPSDAAWDRFNNAQQKIGRDCVAGQTGACVYAAAPLASVCLLAPGVCATAAKLAAYAYTAFWLGSLQGHNEQGGHIEAVPDPVTATADGVFGSAYRCGDRWQAGDCALTVGNLLMLGRAGMMSPTARAVALSAYLETAPLEFEAPEVAAMRAFQSGPSQMSRAATPAALPSSSGAFSPWSSFLAPQSTMSWADAASAARRSSFAEQWAQSPIADYHAAAYGPGEYAGLGVELEAGPATTILTSRPTWQQTEADALSCLQDMGFTEQVSFVNGEPVARGTPGSTRPDLYSDYYRLSVDTKNYEVCTPNGRSRLVKNVVEQAQLRAPNLPFGTRQAVILDVRGQVVNQAMLDAMVKRIAAKSGGTIRSEDIVILSDP